MKARTLLALAATCAALAACGGGDGGGTPASTPTADANTVPQSARDSAAGLVAYLQDLIANHTNETDPPVSLEGVTTLPVDDNGQAAGV